MPNNYPVIATGPQPPSRQALLGQAVGLGGGAILGNLAGQAFQQRRLAGQIADPLSAAYESLGQDYQPRTPQEAFIYSAMQDPRQFAQIAGNQANAVNLLGGVGGTPAEAYHRDIVIEGSSERGKELGLQPDERARVRFSYDAKGQLIGQPSVVANPFGGDETDEPFGAGARGKSLEHVSNLAPSFANATTTPEQDRIFLTAVSNLTQPERYTDPDTGLLVERRGEIPNFVRNALKARGVSLDPQSGMIIPPLGSPPNEADVTAANAARQEQPTLSEDAVIGTRPGDIPTLYESASQGDFTGPIPGLRRGLARFGVQAQTETSALTFFNSMSERLVRALQQSPRYAEGEAERISKDFGGLDPSLVDISKGGFLGKIIGVDEALERIQQESYEVLTGKRAMVPGETRQHAMSTLNAVTNAREWLAPQRVRTDAEAEQFNATHPPGTPVLYFEDDQWKLGYTEGSQ